MIACIDHLHATRVHYMLNTLDETGFTIIITELVLIPDDEPNCSIPL